MPPRQLCLVSFAALWLASMLGCAPVGQFGLSPELDPGLTAQVALERGLEAAKQQDWKQAIKYFDAAQERAHLSPTIMFNLGLAHAKAGNELLANVWFRAYVAAMPDAANAEAVKAEIKRLEPLVEGKIPKLFQQAIAAAELLPIEGERKDSSHGRREEALRMIAHLQFKIGDFVGGESSFLRSKQVAPRKSSIEYLDKDESRVALFAEFLAGADDVEGAERLLAKIPGYRGRDSVLGAIARARMTAGDLEGARRTLTSMESGSAYYESSRRDLSLAYAEKGDMATAEWLAQKAHMLRNLAIHALREGNVSEARRLARRALSMDPKDNYALAMTGDPETALQSIANQKIDTYELAFSWYGWGALETITECLLLLGDRPSARKASSLARQRLLEIERKRPEYKEPRIYALAAEAYVLAAEGHVRSVINKTEEAVASAPSWFRSDGVKDLIATFAIRVGNLEAAEKVIEIMVGSEAKIDRLRKVATGYEKKRDASNAARIKSKVAELDARARMGWVAKTSAQEAAVKAWVETARELARDGRFADFQNFLEEIKGEKAHEIPSSLAYAAGEFAKGLRRIHAQEARVQKLR